MNGSGGNEFGLLGAAAIVLGIAGVSAFISYRQKQSAAPPASEAPSSDSSDSQSDAYANHPLLEHIGRIIAVLSDRESGDRACSRALDVVLQLTNTEEGRVLLSRQGILAILVELLYRCVPTPSPPSSSTSPPSSSAPLSPISPSSSASSLSSSSFSSFSSSSSPTSSSSFSAAAPSISTDLRNLIQKALWSISNLSLDLANQKVLRKVYAFPLLVRFLAPDVDDEIQLRALQALLNLSVFENLNEDALRDEGLLTVLPALLSRSHSDQVRWTCLKVLRNLAVSNQLNAKILLENDAVNFCLGLLGECDILSQRSLELVRSLLPADSPIPPVTFDSAQRLLALIDSETALSDSLKDLASVILPLLHPHLDQQALTLF